MTIKEALAVLEQHRITRSIYDTTRLVIHNADDTCEQIGEIYQGQQSICIAEYIPSEIGMTYSEVKKSIVSLDRQSSDTLLQSILDDLPVSSLHYEETLRHKKIENVKRYFEQRKIDATLARNQALRPDQSLRRIL